jgi:hypothetical protein
MAEVLCVYREVAVLKKASAKSKKPRNAVAIVSCDEKPGIQTIAINGAGLCALSQVNGGRKTPDLNHNGDCTRDGGLPVGDRPRGAAVLCIR